MMRLWSVRLNAEADRLTRLGNRWPAISLHASILIADAARSMRKAAEDMAARERNGAVYPKRKAR